MVWWVLGREMAGGLHLTVLVAWGIVLCLSGGVVLVGVWWGMLVDEGVDIVIRNTKVDTYILKKYI